MGESNKFGSRLTQIKNTLDLLGLQEINESLEIFEDLLRASDPETFIKNNYDQFNEEREFSEIVIDESLPKETYKKTFKLGLYLSQYIIEVTADMKVNELAHIIDQVLWYVEELLDLQVFAKSKEKEIKGFIQDQFIPITDHGILILKQKIHEWFSERH